MQITTHSADETQALGQRLAKRLLPGDVIAYFGDLGAGKTALTRGIAQGLGVTDLVTSPTYTIVNEYLTGRIPLSEDDRAAKSCIELSVRGSLTDEERSTMQEAIAAPNVGGVVRLTGFILN